MRYNLEQMLAEVARDAQHEVPPSAVAPMTQEEIRALRLRRRVQRQQQADMNPDSSSGQIAPEESSS